MTLSVRYRMKGDPAALKPFIPGVLVYGNPSNKGRNDGRVPTYFGEKGEFAIFEELMLRIIIGKKDVKVVKSQTEYPVKSLQGRGVRFDVFARDSEGREYDIEIQRSDHGAEPRRAHGPPDDHEEREPVHRHLAGRTRACGEREV